jgi:hypothetical protein
MDRRSPTGEPGRSGPPADRAQAGEKATTIKETEMTVTDVHTSRTGARGAEVAARRPARGSATDPSGGPSTGPSGGPSTGPPPLAPDTRVEVRTRFDQRWTRGFEVVAVEEGGYRLRRLSDGSELPTLFFRDDLRRERRRQGQWWY